MHSNHYSSINEKPNTVVFIFIFNEQDCTHVKVSLHSAVVVAVAETLAYKVAVVEDVVGHQGLHVSDVTLLGWPFACGVDQPRVGHQVALSIHQEASKKNHKPDDENASTNDDDQFPKTTKPILHGVRSGI
jgi:hypothetical protein